MAMTTFSVRIFNEEKTESAVLSFAEETEGVLIPESALSGVLDAKSELAKWAGKYSTAAQWWEEGDTPGQAACGQQSAQNCRVWNTPSGLAFAVCVP